MKPGPQSGKIVFVTGAARPTGQAIFISFVAAGADPIAIVDREDASLTRMLALQAAADADWPLPEILVLQIDPVMWRA